MSKNVINQEIITKEAVEAVVEDKKTTTKAKKSTKKASETVTITVKEGEIPAKRGSKTVTNTVAPKKERAKRGSKTVTNTVIGDKITKIIAIDAGKRNIKALSANDEKIIFGNKRSIGHSEFNNTGTFNVTYQDLELSFGSQAVQYDARAGKATKQCLIGALIAITNFIEPSEEVNENLGIVYGESITKFYSTNNKEQIIKLLLGNHKITVNNNVYSFRIKEVKVVPEGIGHIISNLKECRGIQYVVDLGGTTVDFLTFDNARPDVTNSRSLDMGTNNIVAKIQSALAIKNIKLSKALIEEYLNKTSTSENEIVIKTIDKVVKEQLILMESEFSDLELSIKDITGAGKNVFFVGGTAGMLKKEIQELFGSHAIVVDEPVWSNVRGFYKYGVAKMGGNK